MTPGFWQILIIAVVAILLFGRGKISGMMEDVALGIKSFKKGMADDETDLADADKKGKVIDHDASEKVSENMKENTKTPS